MPRIVKNLFIIILFVFVAGQGRAVAATFTGVGDVAGGGQRSAAHDVSADGTTVVGLSETENGEVAFRWTLAGGIAGLGDLAGGSDYSTANAVSADGTVVAGTSGSATHVVELFRWTQASGMVGLGDLPGGTAVGNGEGISADGAVIVGASETEGDDMLYTLGVRWTQPTGLVPLPSLPGGDPYSFAHDVSADGLVVVGESTSGGDTDVEAFRWTQAGGMVGLGALMTDPMYSEARAVSADGATVVGWSDSMSGQQAFRWTAATGMIGLGYLPDGFSSLAYDVSADGSIVVGMSDGIGGVQAFIWDATNGMRNLREVLENDHGLDLTAWTLVAARGISDDGSTIVGQGINPLGDEEGWFAELTPATMDPLLSVALGPGPTEVTLSWSGGQPDFSVYRASDPRNVVLPANELGTTPANTWIDDPPAGTLHCYCVESGTTGG